MTKAICFFKLLPVCSGGGAGGGGVDMSPATFFAPN